ncbi:ATP-dependent DNA helicase PIF1 [Phanerochaete sordida]|uniref:ATP-dependent DNA helicase n=1 Tax=Phanerochaete sordida TaxID=48140 RepID=A0A9P3G2H9_9APHY|nr:ATP-dependent DNA helicase PIF1 [Phanerochaete sordida]
MGVKWEDDEGLIPAPDPPELAAEGNAKNDRVGLEYEVAQTAPPVADIGDAHNDEDPAPAVQLSDEQQAVLDRVKAGETIFFTGSAGTGKSVLLREIVRWCRTVAQKNTAVTASTGIAGYHVGGSTLHSWAGIGLGIGSVDDLIDRILECEDLEHERAQKRLGGGYDPEKHYYTPLQNWLETQVLVIDEVSMIPGSLFGKLENIARRLRGNERPFGGIQLVLAGDFYQLPPVHKKGYKRPKLAFQSWEWRRCVGPPVVLKKVFRQKDDKLINMLNAVRFATLDEEAEALLLQLSRKVEYPDGEEPIDLYPVRSAVEVENRRRLAQLDEHQLCFKAHDDWKVYETKKFDKRLVQKGLDELGVPEKLMLKKGARVMLNMVQGRFVNGSIGEVRGFMTVPEAKAQNILVGTPSIKKKAVLDRQAEQNDHQFSLLVEDGVSRWPLVSFNGHEFLCVPRTFPVLTPDGKCTMATRVQLPLILAWALTIHKSQGQTIPRLRVHLGDVFDFGQAYVALSRATSLDTLEVVNFEVGKIKVHPNVRAWMRLHEGRQVAAPQPQPPQPEPALARALPAADHLPPPDAVPPAPAAIKREPIEALLPVKAEPGLPQLRIKPEPVEDALPLVKREEEGPALLPKDESDDDDDDLPPPPTNDVPAAEDYTTDDELWAQCRDSDFVVEENGPIAGPSRKRKREATPEDDTDEEYYWSHSQDVSMYLGDIA